jgi:hypothetical protein
LVGDNSRAVQSLFDRHPRVSVPHVHNKPQVKLKRADTALGRKLPLRPQNGKKLRPAHMPAAGYLIGWNPKNFSDEFVFF